MAFQSDKYQKNHRTDPKEVVADLIIRIKVE